MKTLNIKLPMLFLVALVFLVYHPVLEFAYVWDDVDLFLNSASLRSGNDVWMAISTPILPGTTYFRPLVLLSFFAEFYNAEPNPAVSHAINVSIHALNSALVGILILKYSVLKTDNASPIVLLLCAAVYAMHPALTEPTTWVAGRFDLLTTTFYLSALIAGLGRSNFSRAIMFCFFFAALLCKEMAITFPVVLILIKLSLTPDASVLGVRESMYKERWSVLGLTVTLSAYLLIRYGVLINLLHVDGGLNNELTLIQHLALVGQTVLFYIERILWPFFSTNPIYPLVENKSTSEFVFVGLSVLVLLFAFAAYALYKRNAAALLLLSVIVCLTPVLHIIPLTIGGNIGHDRFMTLPLALVAILFYQSIVEAEKLRLKGGRDFGGASGLKAIGVFFIVLSIIMVPQNLQFWRSNVTLWSWAHAVNPGFQYAKNSLIASILNDGGNIAYAELMLSQAIDVDEVGSDSQLLMIMVDYRAGRLSSSLEKIDKILAEKKPLHLEYQRVGLDWRKTDAPSREIFSTAGKFKYLYSLKAEIYLRQKLYSDAEGAALAAIFYQKDDCATHYLLGVAQKMQGKITEGDSSIEAAKQLCSVNRIAALESTFGQM